MMTSAERNLLLILARAMRGRIGVAEWDGEVDRLIGEIVSPPVTGIGPIGVGKTGPQNPPPGTRFDEEGVPIKPLVDRTPSDPPWKPTHWHYRGDYYRVIVRSLRESDLTPMVTYDNQAGVAFTRPAEEFDEVLANGRRRYEPIK